MPDEPMSSQQRAAETKRKRTREWIIGSTVDLYGDLKEGDFTREQIAEAAGVGLTTLSNHFPLKYEILREAHNRTLAPITEPIKAGKENGTYKPEDGIDELIRYTYAITKMCYDHRALTVATIRAYFEPTEYGNTDLGGSIQDGFWPILRASPFMSGDDVFGDAFTRASKADLRHHTWALMMWLYHIEPDSDPRFVAEQVYIQIILASLDVVDIQDIHGRSEAIHTRVDEWFKRRKNQEMRGW